MRHHRPPYDPLAPLRPRQVRRQATRDVLASTRPEIRDITREITRRAAAGSANISGITNELAKNLGSLAPQEHAIYDSAKGDLGHLDTAIADRLAAAGQGGAATLKKQASLTGIPSALVESLAGGAAQAGAGAGASGFARGSAEVAALNSRGAGAEDYAAKMPGLARLSGLQGVKETQAAAQRDLATQLDRIRASTPSLIASSLNAARNREVNKATAGLGYQSNVYGTNTRAATSRYGANTRAGSTQAQIHAANARAAARLAEQQRHDQHQEATAARNARTARINARAHRFSAHHPAKKKGGNKFSYGDRTG